LNRGGRTTKANPSPLEETMKNGLQGAFHGKQLIVQQVNEDMKLKARRKILAIC
jgi:hypothetical protein